MIFRVILTVSVTLLIPSICLSDDELNQAKTQAIISNLPVATILSDIVTIKASSAIASGLSQVGDVRDYSIDQSRFAELKTDALSKGYILRRVELDPTFQMNVSRIERNLDVGILVPPSDRYASELPPPDIVAAAPSGQAGSGGGGGFIGDILGGLTFDNPNGLDRAHGNVGSAVDNLRATPVQELSNERIFGGAPIPREYDPFPDAVAIVGNNKLCSGVLVNAETVLTAAHCYCDGVSEAVIFGTSIVTPRRTIKIDVEKSASFIPCENIKGNIGSGDVAILRLTEPADVEPRAIGGLPLVRSSASVRAVGFGRTAQAIGFKYQVNIVIASYQCDGSAFSNIPDNQVYRCNASHELVAAGLNRDTCGGDSGGEIVAFGEDTKPYVVGVTSRSVDPHGECGPGGIYVLLSASPIREWLASNGIAFP